MSTLQTQLVKKKSIIDSGDFNLSANRYLENVEISSDYPLVRLGDIASFQNGFAFKKSDWVNTGKPIIRIQNLTNTGKYFNRTNRNVDKKYNVENGDLLISWSATIGVFIWNGESALLNQHIFLVKPNDMILKKYFYFLGNNIKNMIQNFVHGNTMTHITKSKFLDIKIPLPPLEIQEQLVKELEGYQQIIDGCRQVVENYKPVIDIDPSWDIKEVNELGEIISGGTPKSTESSYWNGDIKWLTLVDLPANEHVTYIKDSKRKITELGLKKSSAKLIAERSVIISTRATIGRIGINIDTVATNQGFKSIVINNESLIPEFIAFQFLSKKDDLINLASGGTFKEISTKNFKTIKLSIPSIQTQKEIITKLEQERKVIEGNKELIKIYEKKIDDKIKELF